MHFFVCTFASEQPSPCIPTFPCYLVLPGLFTCFFFFKNYTFFSPTPFLSVRKGKSASPIHKHLSPETAEHGEDKLCLLLPLAALPCHPPVLGHGLLTHSAQKPKISHPMIWLWMTERPKPSHRSRWRGQRKRCRCPRRAAPPWDLWVHLVLATFHNFPQECNCKEGNGSF